MKRLIIIGIICISMLGCYNDKTIRTTKFYNNISDFKLVYSDEKTQYYYIDFNDIHAKIDFKLVRELRIALENNKSIYINLAIDCSKNKVICVEVIKNER